MNSREKKFVDSEKFHNRHGRESPDENYSISKKVDLNLLLEQLVRNILNDPLNVRIIGEYLKLSSDPDGTGRVILSIPKNTEGPSRDISNCETVRPRDLPQVTGLSRTQCWRLAKDPNSGFPPKIHLSSGAVGFSRKLIEKWLESKQEIVND